MSSIFTLIPARSNAVRHLRRLALPFALTILLGVIHASDASAQLFGTPRQIGNPLQRQASPGSATQSQEQIGSLQGNERFMRDNRTERDFVGSSRLEGDGFVGSVQAIGTGRVATAAETLQPPPDAAARLNRPLPPLAVGTMYYPRLMLDLGVAPPPDQEVIQVTTSRLEKLLPTGIEGVRLDVADRRATLSGTVADEAMKRRIEILISFEPGIDSVDNQLRIESPAPLE